MGDLEGAGSPASNFLAAAGHKLGSMFHAPSAGTEQEPGQSNLKVRIMTWNMHGKIPKGDLEILLGRCDPYNPADAPRVEPDALPQLPLTNSHPYHLVVIACQECPWGAGGQLTTTLHTAGEIGSLARGRTRAARDLRSGEHRRHDGSGRSQGHESDHALYSAGSMESIPHIESPTAVSPSHNKVRPPLSVQVDDASEHERNSPQSPRTDAGFWERTTAPGWSKICEDWFCYATSPSRTTSPSCPSSPQDRGDGFDTDSRVSEPMASVGQTMDRLQHELSRSSLRTESRSESPCISPQDMRRPPQRLGPYELVIKERMMGCYSAVYVWRPCHDMIHGASANVVKSGLLAGRMGNKGGVGISIHFGTTRLLFVNAHLAGTSRGSRSTCKQNQRTF